MSFRQDETRPNPLDSRRDAPIKVTREIPLWGLLCVIGALAGQAVTMYYSLERQADKQRDQTEAIKVLAGKIDRLAEDNNARAAKDNEHDWKLADHERRIQAIELRGKP